jgi:1-acyl-sn-glycerol-3-phosphate acyltransferase
MNVDPQELRARMRASARLLALVTLTLVFWSFLLVSCLPAWIAGRHAFRWRLRLMTAWARHCCRIAGIRVNLEGAPPSPPFMLVSNHVSYLDILAIAAVVPAVFVAKSEIERWPVLGAICRSAATLFLDRSSGRDLARVIELVDKRLDSGLGVTFFAEGGLADGVAVRPFRSPLLEAAIRRGLAVHHVALRYETGTNEAPARRFVVWDGESSLGAHFLRLLRLRNITATAKFGREPVRAEDRKALAARLHEAVARDFTPLAG